MTLKVDDRIQGLLLGNIPGVDREGNRTFLKFDRLTVDTTTGVLSYFWEGKHMASLTPRSYEPGTVLTLTGIEGRTELYVE